MKPTVLRVVLVSSVLLTEMPMAAHHSFDATYFMSERITVEGDVARALYRNPHSFLQVKSTVPGTGAVIVWAVEWNGTKRLGRESVTRETLKIGDHVVMTGQPGKGSDKYPDLHRLLLETILRPADGWNWHRGRHFD
jgi:hypothetical protein